MNPEWRDPKLEDAGKYAFIEQLPSNAPPALLIVFCNPDGCFWRYWTTTGWAVLTGRVCVFERPL